MEKYIVLTPVGEHKEYCLKEFINSIKNFNPLPEKIVLCIDLDSSLDRLKEMQDLTILYNPEIFCSKGELERICSAREILRKYFIYSKYNWALWIDSDIICPPNTAQIFSEILKKEKYLMISNKYQGRNDKKWSGSGCMFTHKIICTLSKFWIGRIDNHNISEDYIFLSLIDQANSIIKYYTGKEGRIIGEFVKTKHLLEKE